jgi:hypothetical protein
MSVARLFSGMHGGSSSIPVGRKFRFTSSYALFPRPFHCSLILHALSQTHFHQCAAMFPEIGCEMFTNVMAKRATTMSLSILVTVEMFNAMNSLSENESLLILPVWKNPFLVAAITLSMALHFAILYIPFFTVSVTAPYYALTLFLIDYGDCKTMFAITPLNWTEWKAVLYLSAPVLLIDEILKYISVSIDLSCDMVSRLTWTTRPHSLTPLRE